MAAQTQSCLLGPAPSELNRPIHWEPINPLGFPEFQSAWMPDLAAAPRSAGGRGQQVGQK